MPPTNVIKEIMKNNAEVKLRDSVFCEKYFIRTDKEKDTSGKKNLDVDRI